MNTERMMVLRQSGERGSDLIRDLAKELYREVQRGSLVNWGTYLDVRWELFMERMRNDDSSDLLIYQEDDGLHQNRYSAWVLEEDLWTVACYTGRKPSRLGTREHSISRHRFGRGIPKTWWRTITHNGHDLDEDATQKHILNSFNYLDNFSSAIGRAMDNPPGHRCWGSNMARNAWGNLASMVSQIVPLAMRPPYTIENFMMRDRFEETKDLPVCVIDMDTWYFLGYHHTTNPMEGDDLWKPEWATKPIRLQKDNDRWWVKFLC